MLTIFSSPKPALGTVRQHQENAIASWRALGEDVQIILAAPQDEVAQWSEKYRCDVISDVECNASGVPVLSSLFTRAVAAARHSVMAYINADIIMTPALPAVIARVHEKFEEFLLIGGRTNIQWDDPLPPGWPQALARAAQEQHALTTRWGSDYFIFTKNYYAEIKPFILGRFYWDNWLIYAGCASGKPVINITPDYAAYHPHHDYAHAAPSEAQLWQHPDAQRNHDLFPNPLHYYTVEESGYLMQGSKFYSFAAPSATYLVMRVRGWLRRVKLAVQKA